MLRPVASIRGLALALLVVAASFASFANAAEDPSSLVPIRVIPTEVTASAGLTWDFNIRLTNNTGVGYYADSVLCLLEERGKGGNHKPRKLEFRLDALANNIGSISAGESSEVRQSVPASIEEGTMKLRIWSHLGDHRTFTIETPVIALKPGPVSTEHPSELLDVAGKKVEVVLFPTPVEKPRGGLLIVHPEGSEARRLLLLANQMSARGYAVMLVSMPGYGLSEGDPDELGDATTAALSAACDRLEKVPGVEAGRMAAWGMSKGAGAVARLAAKRSDLAAVVLESGVYAEGTPGKGAKVSAAALVLHGEADAVTPVAKAKSFVAAWIEAGGSADTKIMTRSGHELSRGEVMRSVPAFLSAKLPE